MRPGQRVKHSAHSVLRLIGKGSLDQHLCGGSAMAGHSKPNTRNRHSSCSSAATCIAGEIRALWGWSTPDKHRRLEVFDSPATVPSSPRRPRVAGRRLKAKNIRTAPVFGALGLDLEGPTARSGRWAARVGLVPRRRGGAWLRDPDPVGWGGGRAKAATEYALRGPPSVVRWLYFRRCLTIKAAW